MGALATRGPPGQGALRRHLVLLGGQDPRGGRASCVPRASRCSSTSPRYNLLNRWVEPDLLDALEEVGAGMIAFTALAQGLLTDKYLDGIPADARINRPGGDSFEPAACSPRRTWPGSGRSTRSRGGAARAWPRWPTRGCCATRGSPRTLIGASSPEQVRENVGALANLDFSRRGARRDRPVRGRSRRQPLGEAEHRPARVATTGRAAERVSAGRPAGSSAHPTPRGGGCTSRCRATCPG